MSLGKPIGNQKNILHHPNRFLGFKTIQQGKKNNTPAEASRNPKNFDLNKNLNTNLNQIET